MDIHPWTGLEKAAQEMVSGAWEPATQAVWKEEVRNLAAPLKYPGVLVSASGPGLRTWHLGGTQGFVTVLSRSFWSEERGSPSVPLLSRPLSIALHLTIPGIPEMVTKALTHAVTQLRLIWTFWPYLRQILKEKQCSEHPVCESS